MRLNAFLTLLNDNIQGNPYGPGKGFVDIKFTLLFQYKPLVLKHDFKIAVNKICSTITRVTLYQSDP